jgi:hypothetical protein
MSKRIVFAGLIAVGMLAVSSSAQAVKPKAAPPAAAPARDWTPADVSKAIAKSDPALLAACKKSHIDENCSFLKSAADYAAQRDVKKRGVLAEQIMHFYLGKEAKQEINLPAAKAEKLTTAYAAAKAAKAKTWPTTLFAEAAHEIDALLVTNINQSNRANFAPVLAGLK